jgi:hypothetical protein
MGMVFSHHHTHLPECCICKGKDFGDDPTQPSTKGGARQPLPAAEALDPAAVAAPATAAAAPPAAADEDVSGDDSAGGSMLLSTWVTKGATSATGPAAAAVAVGGCWRAALTASVGTEQQQEMQWKQLSQVNNALPFNVCCL